jgi:hypothetical protein
VEQVLGRAARITREIRLGTTDALRLSANERYGVLIISVCNTGGIAKSITASDSIAY